MGSGGRWVTFQQTASLSAASLIAGLLLGCEPQAGSIQPPQAGAGDGKVVIRITEEPYYQQEKMNRKMKALEDYLENSDEIDVEYVPAINYAHSHQLLLSGKVDLLWAGSLGVAQVEEQDKDNLIQPLAVEKPSFVNVLLVSKQASSALKQSLKEKNPLRSLKRKRVLFGSRSSGSSFLTPLLEMKDQGVALSDLKSCAYEPHHGHRADYFASSRDYDFAFMPGQAEDPLRLVSPSAQADVEVAWLSEPKRNYSVLVSEGNSSPQRDQALQAIQSALTAMDSSSGSGSGELLKVMGVAGFDLPADDVYLEQNRRISELSSELSGREPCLDIDAPAG